MTANKNVRAETAARIVRQAAIYMVAAGRLAVDSDNVLRDVARSMRAAAENDGQHNPATFRAWSTAWTETVRDEMFLVVEPETLTEYKKHTDADRDSANVSDECMALHVAMMSAKSRFSKCTRLYKAVMAGDASAEAVYAGDLSFYAWTKNIAGAKTETDAKTDAKTETTGAGETEPKSEGTEPETVTISVRSPEEVLRDAIRGYLATGKSLSDVMAMAGEIVRESVGATV